MIKLNYIKLSKDQIEKVGNSLIYLSNKISNLSKTKALKLLYILDELAIKRSGIPFFNLKYKVWKFGPVSEEIFIDLSSDTSMLKDFIKKGNGDANTCIIPVAEFVHDEFTENEVELLDFVIENFGKFTAKDLVSHTHRDNSPWHIAAKENDVLEMLRNEEISNTEILVDMSTLVAHDLRKQAIYLDFLNEH